MTDGLSPADFTDAVCKLRDAGIDSPRLEARMLREAAEKPPEVPVIPQDDAPDMPADTGGRFAALLARRLNHEPMAYITGHREFWGLDFRVGPGVLVPRPDTETIIDAVTQDIPDRARPLEILDLGTGSGCILAALLHEYPKAHGTALEASALARKYAAANFQALGLAERVQLLAANWSDGLHGSYDLVVSNPPYIESGDIAGLDPDVADYEPVTALDGGPDGLSPYRRIFPMLNGILNPGGRIAFEFGLGQDAELVGIARKSGLIADRVAKDLAGIGRVLVAKRP